MRILEDVYYSMECHAKVRISQQINRGKMLRQSAQISAHSKMSHQSAHISAHKHYLISNLDVSISDTELWVGG